jgi:hypothetical protein
VQCKEFIDLHIYTTPEKYAILLVYNCGGEIYGEEP